MNSTVAPPSKHRQILAKGQFLDTLRVEDLDDLEPLMRLHAHPPGTVLFREEEEPQEISLLLDGRIRLTINSTDGKRFLLRIAEPGEIVGLASALTGARYEMSAEAQDTCSVGRIKRTDFLHFLDRHPSVLQSVSIMLAASYNQACVRFRTLGGTPSVPAKVARFLLELSSTSASQTERGTIFQLGLTHLEIAECIGACRESVSRAIRDLRQRDLITLHGAFVTIHDRASLEIYAGDQCPQGRTAWLTS